MQTQGIEDLVLSGEIFNKSRPSSPFRPSSRSRSPSPEPLWETNGNSTDSDLSIPPPERESVMSNGMGGTKGGVKGVLHDRNMAVSMELAQNKQQIKEINRRMEKMALNGRTYAEEEEERLRDKERLEGPSAQISATRHIGRLRHFERSGWFGHLREITSETFLEAVENELSGVWVLIHIYDPSLPLCHELNSTLAKLARRYPQTKFLRARAGAIDFLGPQYTHRPSKSSESKLITISEKESYSDDEDDPYLYDDEEDEDQDSVDPAILPTLLAYRSGQLVHSWIRVDMEAEAWTKRGDKGKNVGVEGVEALLQGHYVIQPTGNGNCGFSSDEDDLELQFSQGDDIDDDELFDL